MHRSLVSLSFILILPTSALASQITVQDCNGLVRWIGELNEDEQAADLAVTLDPEAPVTLRRAYMKSSSGPTYTGVVQGDELKFEEVGEGVFKLCSPEGDFIPFLAVTKASAQSGGSSILAGAGLLGLASLGTIAAIDSTGDSSTSSREGTGPGGNSSAAIAQPPAAPAESPSFDPEDYNLGAPAAPLSPYL